MKKPRQRKFVYVIIFLSIVIPSAVMLIDIQSGVILLLLGSWISYQVVRSAARSHEQENDSEAKKLARHRAEQSHVILVQLVDQFGRDLPMREIQKRMDEARANAGPRDTVVGVRYVISKE
jgi:ABC-type nickel/cobalt efflux system permease component RcnA